MLALFNYIDFIPSWCELSEIVALDECSLIRFSMLIVYPLSNMIFSLSLQHLIVDPPSVTNASTPTKERDNILLTLDYINKLDD